MRLEFLSVLIVAACAAAPRDVESAAAVAPLAATGLRCEYFVEPVGIDLPRPQLSWIVTSADEDARGRRQTAWQVRAAGARERLGRGAAELWDSGWVESARTLQIAWDGAPLHSRESCWWQVRVRDEAGREGPWSEPASFVTGVMEPEEWSARWIGDEVSETPALGIGYHAAVTTDVNEEKWVGVDLGEARDLERVVLVPVRDHLGHTVFGFPLRFVVETADDPDFAAPRVVFDARATDVDLASLETPPGVAPAQARNDFVIAVAGVRTRYLRVRATKLYWAHNETACFALAELQAESGGRNVALAAPVLAKDGVAHSGWVNAALTDGSRGLHERVSTLLRREFTPRGAPARAVVHVCGLGQYVLTLDGRNVGDDWLTPGWTQYGKTCLYDTYDVTECLRQAGGATGTHCLGLHLGGGMYDMRSDTRGAQQPNSSGSRKAILELHLEYPDGTREVVRTDAAWRAHAGAETYCGVFGGEDFDARSLAPGWNLAGFDDRAWPGAREVPPPAGRLFGLSRAAPPVRVIETRTPVATSEPKPGVLVLDLGQNAPWVPELTVAGPAGAVLRVWPAEILAADGTVNQETMRPGKRATYTLRGDGAETWHPAFWYCGARYWQAEAFGPAGEPLPARELLREFRGLLVHSSSTPVGSFTCSNALFNRTRELIEWALRSNMASIITDCPHREKSGWLEQIHLVAPGMMFTYDMMPLFRKTMSDMRDAQLVDGMVPTTAPEYFIYEKGFRHSIEWGGACFFLPRLIRDGYGDTAFLGEYYPMMKRYLDWLGTQAPDGLLDGGLGDWDGGFNARTPIPLTGTAYYHLGITTLERVARDLGKGEDAAQLHALGERVRAKFNDAYLDRATGEYAGGSQASQALALDLGLAPPELAGSVFERLLEDVAAGDYAVNCGEIGHPSMLRALADGGRSDVVFRMHSQSDRPGYGWHVTHGATTLTETWDCGPISHNHFMLGHILEWFYRDVAGLRADPEHPAFEHFFVRPDALVGDLTWAQAHYDSIRGRIEVAWRRDGERFQLDVTVPPNATASIDLPTGDPALVRESGRPAAQSPGVSPAGVVAGRARFEVGSGRYKFEAPLVESVQESAVSAHP